MEKTIFKTAAPAVNSVRGNSNRNPAPLERATQRYTELQNKLSSQPSNNFQKKILPRQIASLGEKITRFGGTIPAAPAASATQAPAKMKTGGLVKKSVKSKTAKPATGNAKVKKVVGKGLAKGGMVKKGKKK